MKGIVISGIVLLIVLSENATSNPPAAWIVLVLTLLFVFFVARFVWSRVRSRSVKHS